MERLSAQDAAFLYVETPETPMHVGSLTLFAPTDVPIETIFQKFRDHTVARFDLLPSYRRRLQPAPLRIDHPVWVREENIDLDYHMKRRTLPQPGTMVQLRHLMSELHGIALDRSRPLWQYYVINGLEGGGFAVYVKVHHAAMDGVAGISTLPVTFDFTQDPLPVVAPERANTQPESTGWWTGFGAVIEGVVQQNIRLLEAGPKIVSALAKLGRHAGTVARMLPGATVPPPRTLFNVSISKDRAFGTASVPLSDARRISKARLVTINDVVLAICAGALRRYLAGKKALPDKSLVAGVPATLREPGHTEINNQSAMLLCTLATDIADPIDRLAAIAEASQRSRQTLQDAKSLISTDFSIFGAPLVATGLAQLASSVHLYDILPPVMNVVISNVPGPRNPMYCSGVPAEHYFPVSIPYHNAALNITVQSYLDSLDFGLVACRKTVPDVQTIADFIAEECEVLKQAALLLDQDHVVEHIEVLPVRKTIANEPVPVVAAVSGATLEAAHGPGAKIT
jgi:diacylglycerol O-acyltransferase